MAKTHISINLFISYFIPISIEKQKKTFIKL